MIAGDIITTEPLAIVASGNITSVDNITIQAASSTSGRRVFLLAGAKIEPVNGSDQTTIGPIPPANTNNGEIYVTGQSKSGGSILLGQNVTFDLRSTEPTGNDNGGGLSLNAFAGKDPASGLVYVDGTSVFAGGRNAGRNGFVSIQAGASKTDSIRTGFFDVTGATSFNFQFLGSVSLKTQQPHLLTPLHISASGVVEAEGFSAKIKQAKRANIVITDVTAGPDILAEDGFNAEATGTIRFEGNVTSLERSRVLGIAGIEGNGGSIGANDLELRSSGNIGTEANPLFLESMIRVNARAYAGDEAALAITTTPFATIAGSAKNNFSVIAPNARLSTGNSDITGGIQAANVFLDVAIQSVISKDV